MNTIRNPGIRVEEPVAGGNQAPAIAPATEVQLLVNPVAMIDGEVREELLQMAQSIIVQAHAITTQSTRGCSKGEPAC